MPSIQNVSRYDVESGSHLATDSGRKVVLIQISDPDTAHPTPAKSFEKIFKFKFLDIEEDQECPDQWRPSADDAYYIASILLTCLQMDYDLVVHCHAGVCRSGAVAEVGEMLGFEYAGSYKQPNVALKKHLMNALGLSFDPEESPFNQMEETKEP